jgi:hypothetical protein
MLIQYYGDYCLKITTKPQGRATDDITLWVDPHPKNSPLRLVQGQADIVLLTHTFGEREALSNIKGDYVIFETPGEYASHGVTIKGMPSFQDMVNGAERGQNTFFTLVVEDLNLCFLGALGQTLTTDQLNHLGSVDILFVPASGDDTLELSALGELIRKIEPAIIIPTHYHSENFPIKAAPLKNFCEEMGNCPENALTKFSLKKKDLDGKSLEVVLLEKA